VYGDECTQASEPEALIPMVLGAKQVWPGCRCKVQSGCGEVTLFACSRLKYWPGRGEVPAAAGLPRHVQACTPTRCGCISCRHMLPAVLLLTCCLQVILVGDHCQLPPVILCKRAAESGLTQTWLYHD
jgi:hypothetical protein